MYWPNLSNRYKPDRKRKNKKKFVFKVRISHLQSSFQREYDIKWSGEIFKISKRFLRQDQPMYKIVDWFNQPMKGTFYQKELQKVRWCLREMMFKK